MEDELRKPLQEFVEVMEQRLKAKDGIRGEDGWLRRHPLWLLSRAEEELAELKSALVRPHREKEIVIEAADVANFCMMISDVMKRGFNNA